MAHIPVFHLLPKNKLNIEDLNMLDFETNEMLF